MNRREAMSCQYCTADQAFVPRFLSQPAGGVFAALALLTGMTPDIVKLAFFQVDTTNQIMFTGRGYES